MTKVLDGKTVIVTGAGRGLGAAYAVDAAEHGANVVVSDVDSGLAGGVAAGIRSAGGQAAATEADVRSSESVERLMDFAETEFGRIDGLVANAGVVRLAPLGELDEQEMKLVLDTNLMGTIICAQAAAKRMMANGGGSIVSASSSAQTGLPLHGVYSATKGGIASLTYAWASETAETGVRFNAIAPTAKTPMSGMLADYLETHDMPGWDVNVLPEPKTNAPIVTYLLSDLAKDVNGQVVNAEAERISLMSHPATWLPYAETSGEWSVEDVHEAFERELAAMQLPVGFAGVRGAPEEVTMPWLTSDQLGA